MLVPTADGVLRCFVRYEAERGRDGRGTPDAAWKDGRRLTSGDAGAEEAGDL